MRVVCCAGMYASGSTWAYNVVRLLARASADQLVVQYFANTLADLAGRADGDVIHIVKTHDLPDDAAARLLAHTPRIVVTLRDPRDAVASLMTYQRHAFRHALASVETSARFAAAMAERTDALVLRYETGFPDDPATIERIAGATGLPADSDTRRRIFAETSRAAVERFIAGLGTLPGALHDPASGDVHDPETQWHRHHAGRSGETGRWRRMLREVQVRAVEGAMADWMDRHGYQRAAAPPQGDAIRLGGVAFRHR
jgi:hypothetical protein